MNFELLKSLSRGFLIRISSTLANDLSLIYPRAASLLSAECSTIRQRISSWKENRQKSIQFTKVIGSSYLAA